MTRPLNKDVRPREYLTEKEIDMLIKAAKTHGHHRLRDSMLILVGFIHGLRVSELINLKWAQVNFEEHNIYVKRLKRGRKSIQPMTNQEIRGLRQLKNKNPKSMYVFLSVFGTSLSRYNVNRIIKRAGEKAGIDFPVHPHMLRHAIGTKLANDGVDTRRIQNYMGHQNIQHTVGYTELNSKQFDGFWE
jgi:site-specific recombinase XerD